MPAQRAARIPARFAREPFLIPYDWPLLAPAMFGVLILFGFVTHSVPLPGAIACGLVALAAIGCSRFLIRYERGERRSRLQRNVAMFFAVPLPLSLFGAAAVLWDEGSQIMLPVQGMAMVAIVSTMATVMLASRVHSIIAANTAIWIIPAFMSSAAGALISLALGLVAGIAAARRQAKRQKLALEVESEARIRQARAEEILQEYERSGQGWFWETDRRGNLIYLSPNIARLVGKEAAAMTGRPFVELFVQDSSQAREGERTLTFHFTARSAFTELSIRANVANEERWWSISGRPVFDEFRNFLGFRGSGHDLTETRRSQEQVARLAHYDSLTGLANRFQMSQTLERILTAPDIGQRACAVLLLDLDRFKQVNDTLGHPAGDALLTKVARRLEKAVGEHGRVGRLGGDEFQVLLVGKQSHETITNLAEDIIVSLSELYMIDGQKVEIGASVGIAIAPQDGETSDALIRNADLALYAAKDGGRGRYHFYAQDLHSDAEERRQLEQDLREALVEGGLELAYQPVVNTSTEEITGFEALLRWNHPTRGPLSPTKFIPIAEEAGLIVRIGEWALRTACKDLAVWPESVRVAVNVSPLQFASPTLPSVITSALAAAQVHPSRLELEITESVFLTDDEGTDAMFAALKRIGVRLSLDDFGTGYSSLGYLKKAPFDKIKIDQSFVRGATIAGSRNGAIIAAIVSMAEALGMESTAEGVETLDELELVRMLGCSHVQGYIYEKPLHLDEANLRLQTGLKAVARGPRSARPARQTMLRKVVLEHGGQHYSGTVRNLSLRGAMIEGLWNVPVGTIFRITFADGMVLTATARWSQQDRMGMEFSKPLAEGEHNDLLSAALSAVAGRSAQFPPLRRANG